MAVFSEASDLEIIVLAEFSCTRALLKHIGVFTLRGKGLSKKRKRIKPVSSHIKARFISHKEDISATSRKLFSVQFLLRRWEIGCNCHYIPWSFHPPLSFPLSPLLSSRDNALPQWLLAKLLQINHRAPEPVLHQGCCGLEKTERNVASPQPCLYSSLQ